jgi:hypothetical protein
MSSLGSLGRLLGTASTRVLQPALKERIMDNSAFVREYESKNNVVSLMKGSPGPETLRDCREILLKATNYMLVSRKK